ncbi:LOW QUALITY PROTEIN: hypothetical protein V3C99_019082 [Haemonchus contortus]
MFRLILLTLLSYALAKPYQQAGTNFCADKQPGLFANGCSSNVTVCNKFGNEIWLLCPFELIFDESVDECMDPRLVSACSGTTPTPQGPVRDVQGLPDRLCEGSTDGYHSATGCSTSVVQCVGGVSRLLECSEGEVFDNAKQGCVPPAEMPACKAAMEPQPTAAPSSGAAQTTAAPSSGAAEPSGPSSSGAVEPSSPSGSGAAEPGSPPSSGAAEPTTAPTSGAADSSSPASSGPTNDCEGLADGFFEKEPCSSFFLTCSGGVSRILTCPASLVFDRKLSVCEYPENVEGCGSQGGEGPSGGAEICSKDGYFSYGNCSDLFYACSNGRQIPMYCPAKLAFDETRQLCDYPLAVAVCTEQGSGEGSGESSGESSGEGSGEGNVGQEAPGSNSQPEVQQTWDGSLDVPSESSTPASETAMALCEGKDDGFYASGCSSEAIACKAGQATSMLCPAHMLFDEHKRMCDYPENVPCYGTGEVEGAQQRKCTVEGPVGTGPCSRVFMNCVEGKAFQLACDDGYVFSVVHRSCAETSKVQECAPAQSPTTEAEKPPMTEQPVQQPEQPVQQPEQPVQQPEQPVQQPEQPVQQPEQPVQQPEQPVQQPEQPVQQPEQPVQQPEQPVQQPEQPVQQPEQPVQQPVQQPEQPVQQPEQPVQQPEQPVQQPEQPVPQPQQPTGETGYATPKPEQPVPQPQQPVPQPQQPVPQPQQPTGETGYATPKPEQPVQQPEQPVQQPEQPVQQPEQPVQQPEQPVQQPEQPVQQPEQPVQQPEQPSGETGYATPKPQQPVPQPQQPVPQPEQPTGETGYATPKPEQPVPQPQQPVPQPQQPVPQPQQPVPQPQQPNGETGYATPKPEQPVQQPEQPAQQPEQPAQQPEQPVQQPEQPVQQPDSLSSNQNSRLLTIRRQSQWAILLSPGDHHHQSHGAHRRQSPGVLLQSRGFRVVRNQ